MQWRIYLNLFIINLIKLDKIFKEYNLYYKAVFDQPIEEDFLEEFDFEIGFDNKVGNEIIYFNNHEFEIRKDGSERINEIFFYNQCTKTHDIENSFLYLLQLLLNDENSITLFDSNGATEILSKEELEYI